MCNKITLYLDEKRGHMVTEREEKAEKKIYVLDTNVLVYDPKSVLSFTGAEVGIPSISLEQLDELKKEETMRGRNTREVIRILDSVRTKGSLRDGVHLDNGEILRVLFTDDFNPEQFPFKMRIEDNEILMTVVTLQQKGYHVIFVSKDLNLRVKADALGIEVQDYLKDQVTQDQFYHGWIRLQVPAVQLTKDIPADLNTLIEERVLEPNEFVLVEAQHNPFNNRVFRYMGGKKFVPVVDPIFPWPLKARNPQQLMALNLLLDPTVQLVCLFGPAGTGKTFLALLTGLYQTVLQDDYEKLLVSRPVVPLGRDIGYLPGTIEEKLRSWMLPVYDNMEYIAHASRMGKHIEMVEQDYPQRDKKGYERHAHGGSELSLDALIRSGKLSLEAITYMRGRSIPYQFILIDEVQNLTPHEVKTIVSRVGDGSKMVLTGDPYQIDSPYLDFASNGLVVTSERFKGQQIFGTVYLEKSERSQLAQLANELL
jgi:PhoH-like ATPase